MQRCSRIYDQFEHYESKSQGFCFKFDLSQFPVAEKAKEL
jgi:hypothetical protein